MKSGKMLKRLVMTALMIGLTFSLLVVPSFKTTVHAEGENAAVTADKTGVLQVKVVYVDDSNVAHDVQSGTAFLINSTTALTANHVVTVDDDVMEQIADLWGNGKTASQCRSKLQIEVTVLEDNTMTATVATKSDSFDTAVLSLQQEITGRTSLKLRKSSEVKQTEQCFALGFPAEFAALQDVATYTSDDVTISDGLVSKIATIGGTDYVVSNAQLQGGFSGGPLVDANGNVIGICRGKTTQAEGFEADYSYSVATDKIISMLDSWNISYDSSDAAPTASADAEEQEEEAPEVDKTKLAAEISKASPLAKDTKYTDASLEKLSDAINAATKVNDDDKATQEQVDSALKTLQNAEDSLEENSFLQTHLVLVIGVGAAVVALIVILIIVHSSKKKKSETYVNNNAGFNPVPPTTPDTNGPASFNNGYNENPATPQPSPMDGNPYAGGQDTTLLGNSAGETTVLGGTAPETTVLNNNNYGVLVRNKDGENIKITRDHFRIGRERNQVDYCVSDNTNIGRLHAEIVSSGSKTYIVDKNSRNHTFVNDVRCEPGQQVELKDGDTVMLADEAFTYHKSF